MASELDFEGRGGDTAGGSGPGTRAVPTQSGGVRGPEGEVTRFSRAGSVQLGHAGGGKLCEMKPVS